MLTMILRQWIDSVALGTAVAADSLTAGTLIVYLFRNRTRYAKSVPFAYSYIH